MKMTIEIPDKEIEAEVKRIITETIAESVLSEYSSDYRMYRKLVKNAIREAINEDKESLAQRAVDAASVSITNTAIKKISTEELLARIAGRDRE